jgi:protein ImuA
MTELLQPPGADHVWQLLAPGLRRHLQPTPGGQGPLCVLVGPPHVPLVAGLYALGLDTRTWLWLQPPDLRQRLWACEQALQCPGVGAVLVWLPWAVPGVALRRLQWAAQRHGGLLWVSRPQACAPQASPAPLRLQLTCAAEAGALSVRVLKRRGPWLEHPVVLPSTHRALQALLEATRWRRRQRVGAETAGVPGHVPGFSQEHAHAVAGLGLSFA